MKDQLEKFEFGARWEPVVHLYNRQWGKVASVLRKAFVAFLTVAFIVINDNVYVPVLAKTLHKTKTRIREACATPITKFFVTCGRRLIVGLMLLQPLVAFILN